MKLLFLRLHSKLRSKFLFHYSKDPELTVIILLSVAMEIIWFSIQHIGYHCDTQAYFQYASQIVGKFQPTYVTWTRTPGYPLLLLFVNPINTLIVLLAMQAAMAIAMPILVYKTLEIYHRKLAFWGALFFIAGLAPFMTSKLIMTEQLFKFLSILLMYCFCRVLTQPTCSFKQLLPLTLTGMMFFLTRPTAAAIFLVMFAILLIVRFKWWKPICVSLSIPFTTLALTSLLLSLYTLTPFHLSWTGGYKPHHHTRITELLFYDLYMNHPEILLDASAGENRAALNTVVERFIKEMPDSWQGRTPFQYFKPYKGKPDAILKRLHDEDPARPYYLLLRDAVLIYNDMGPDAETRKLAHKLIPAVIREVYLDHPGLFPEFWWRYMTAAIKTTGAAPQVVYYNMFAHDRVAKLKAENGPASKKLMTMLKDHFRFNPENISTVAPVAIYKKDYTGHPDTMVDEVLAGNPDGNGYYNTWIIVDHYLGPIEAIKLYTEVNKEGILNGWVGQDSFYEHFYKRGMKHLRYFLVDPFLGGVFKDGFSVLGWFNSIPFYFDYNLVFCADTGNARMNKEVQSGLRLFHVIPNNPGVVIASTNYGSPENHALTDAEWNGSLINVFIHLLWDIARFASSVVIVLGTIFCLRSKVIIPIIVSLIAIAQHSISASFMIGAQTRYVDQIQPMIILCACLVIVGIVERFKGRKTKKL